jgi:hypothetical protein
VTGRAAGPASTGMSAPSPCPTCSNVKGPTLMNDRIEALKQLSALRDAGVLSDDEFRQEKARVLGTSSDASGSSADLAASSGPAPTANAIATRAPPEPAPPAIIHIKQATETSPPAEADATRRSGRTKAIVLGVLCVVLASMGFGYWKKQQETLDRLAAQAAHEAAARVAKEAQLEQERRERAAQEAALEQERARRSAAEAAAAAPRVSVVNGRCDSCDGFFESCIEVECVASNSGGTAALALISLEAGGEQVTKEVYVDVHDSQRVRHRFRDNTGTRCTCSLSSVQPR